MKPLHKDDIEILDYIVNESLKHATLTPDMLKKLNSNAFWGDIMKQNDYKRYFEILKEWNVVEVLNGFNRDEQYIQSKTDITKRFIKERGFKKEYEDQQKELDRIEKIRIKELDDAKISKWTKNTYWLTFVIAILGFGIAVWAFIRTF